MTIKKKIFFRQAFKLTRTRKKTGYVKKKKKKKKKTVQESR